jgi:hypothetical protein
LEGEARELCVVAFGRGEELWKPINYVSAAIDHCLKDTASAGEVTWTPRASLQPDGVNELKKVGGKEFGGPVYTRSTVRILLWGRCWLSGAGA